MTYTGFMEITVTTYEGPKRFSGVTRIESVPSGDFCEHVEPKGAGWSRIWLYDGDHIDTFVPGNHPLIIEAA